MKFEGKIITITKKVIFFINNNTRFYHSTPNSSITVFKGRNFYEIEICCSSCEMSRTLSHRFASFEFI